VSEVAPRKDMTVNDVIEQLLEAKKRFGLSGKERADVYWPQGSMCMQIKAVEVHEDNEGTYVTLEADTI
jgi:hypothetical protein